MYYIVSAFSLGILTYGNGERSLYMEWGPVSRQCEAIRNADLGGTVMEDWCCLIDSNLVGERIVLVAREPHVERARMLYPGSVVYTCDEITRMDGAGPETVREIHGVKKAFSGSLLGLMEPSATSTPGSR